MKVFTKIITVLKCAVFLAGAWVAVHLLPLAGWVAVLVLVCRLKKALLAKKYLFLTILVIFISFAYIWIERGLLKDLGYLQTRTGEMQIVRTGDLQQGEIFPLEIKVTDIDTPFNVVRTDLNFNPAQLEVVDLSTFGSLIKIFVQQEVDNQTGFVRLAGGLPNPGYSEPKGHFATLYFRTKQPGEVKINFLSSSLVLANDGQGTNILTVTSALTFAILAEGEVEQGIKPTVWDYLARFDCFVINFWQSVFSRLVRKT
jgi:hypothetical protein